MYGDFNQLFSSSWQKQDPNSALLIDFSTRMGDGVNSALAYDENGNIKAMKQWGLKLMSSDLIDDLTYHYAYNGSSNTNKLLNVADAKSDTATKLGDFHYSALYTSALGGAKPATAVDYVYDANGNLTQDLNKNIKGGTYNGILYNYLNLPIYIPMAAGTIDYIYDAAGNKLSKEVTENNGGIPHPKITDYIGPMVYQDSVLQFISDEEGRIRYRPASGAIPASFVYDYFIKDHLGNVRMVLTDELQTDTYPAATMETTNAAIEDTLYSKIEETRTDIRSITGYPTDTYITPNNSVARVSASVGGSKTGPGITLRVMSGDNFSIRVSSWYKSNGVSSATPVPNPLPDLIAALATGIGGLPNAHGTMADLQDGSLLTPGLTNFFTSRDETTNSSRPKAYLNWVLFDEQFRFVSASSGAEQVPEESAYNNGSATPNVYTHVKTNLPVTNNGYLYIYVSNETPNIDVFFDNLQVTHTRGPLLDETHYYPWGLTMAGISSKALNGAPENKHKWNNGSELASKEFEDGSGLELYETPLRSLDPQLGKWWQIDSKPDHSQSLYASMGNNPILHNDPLGDSTIYYDASGNVLSRSTDKDKNAVTIVSDANLGAFNLLRTALGELNVDMNGNLVNGIMRLLGESYDIQAMFDFVDANAKNNPNTQIDMFKPTDGKGPLINEQSPLMENKNGIWTPNPDEIDRTPGNPFDVNLMGTSNKVTMHTHENEGREISITSGGQTRTGHVANGTESVDDDVPNAINAPGTALFQVAVGRGSVYFYNKSGVVLTVNRDAFNRKYFKK